MAAHSNFEPRDQRTKQLTYVTLAFAPKATQGFGEEFVFGLTEIRISLKEGLRLHPGLFDQFDIGDAGHAQTAGKPGLARAEKFAGATQGEVLFGEEEAIVRLRHGLQAFVLRLVFVRGDEQTVRLV
jgi:hypothetical protein